MGLTEKYHPKSLDEIVGQDSIIKEIKNALSREDKPHFLFVGGAGTGKTSTAECIARFLYGEEWKAHFTELNASDDRGIDMVRNKVKSLSRTIYSKIILLDECDSMTPEAQDALRRIVEPSYGSKYTMFIFSANREWDLIEPIKSRCVLFRFKNIDSKVVLKRLLDICVKEEIRFPLTAEAKEVLKTIAVESNGDLRRAINDLEKVINDKKEIVSKIETPKSTSLILSSVMKAYSGDWKTSKEILESAYVNENQDKELILKGLFDSIDSIPDEDVKVRLYTKIAETERNLKLGTNPIIQFVAFLGWVWALPHFPKSCPIREGA